LGFVRRRGSFFGLPLANVGGASNPATPPLRGTNFATVRCPLALAVVAALLVPTLLPRPAAA